MDQPTDTALRIGAWHVEPNHGRMSRGDDVVRLEPRTMRLLLLLARRVGETVSADEMLEEVWPGVIVTPDSVYQAVASLRRLLGDDPKQPSYIATVPRAGYRMVASVGPWRDAPAAPASRRTRRWPFVATVLGAVLAVAAVLAWRGTASNTTAIAVLPFADLTDDMGHETFADGMTEELIDKLSGNAGLRVSAPTASFYYKEKSLPLAQIARELRVSHLVDGSVRRSASTLRVAVRLVRADDGSVVWSSTYDRPADDLVKVQDEIAGDVAQALARDPGLGRDRAAPDQLPKR